MKFFNSQFIQKSIFLRSLGKYEVNTKEKKKESQQVVSYFKLYRFATPWDFFLLFLAFFFTLLKAAVMPIACLLYSEMAAILVDRNYGIGTSSKTQLLELFGGGKILTNATFEENHEELYNDSIAYLGLMMILSIILLLCGIFCVDLFNYVAIRQITVLRRKFFEAIIRNDIGWHDAIHDQNFAMRITDDIEKIRDGIAEKMCHFLCGILTFVISICIALAYGWKLTLAVGVYVPIVFLTNWIVAKYQSVLTTKDINALARAGGVFEEVLSGIRTVVAFHGEEKEADRYNKFLKSSRLAGQLKGAFSGFGDGMTRSLLFLSCSAAFWYGINLILEDRDKEVKEYTPAILMIAFFGILIGADNISRISPYVEAFSTARGAAKPIFDVIDGSHKIDPMSPDGKILNYGLRGDIELQDVFFKYPSREEVPILRGINIKIESGQMVALVGSSGCGKSTCLQLIQRFYDPDFGAVLLDGLDVRKYNTSWLRSNIGVVGQEPVLFQTTIAENIRFGKPDATQKEIEDAAKHSGVHDFITNLPQSYNTMVGEKGAQLSGGQKQRIAIARALIQNPKILLLDEATSALDYHSEQLVQDALDKVRKQCKCTTVVVSHRLSAIKDADRIMYIENGKVLEVGNHEELMKLNGNYYNMVTCGGLSNSDDDIDKEIEDLKCEDIPKITDPSEKNLIRQQSNLSHHHHDANHHVHFIPVSYKESEREDEDKFEVDYMRTFKKFILMAKSEWGFLALGFVAATLFGCVYPAFAVFFGEVFASMAAENEQDVIDSTSFVCICFLVVGILAGILCFFQTFLFHFSGVRLITKVRSDIFKSIMRQEMAWFDEDGHSVGALSARIAGDTINVQSCIGHSLSGIIQALTNLILGIAIGFYFSWKLALMCSVAVPLLAGSVILEARLMTSRIHEEKAIIEEAARIATEAITNIRTVASLRQEPHMISRFNDEIIKAEKKIKQKLKYRGLINSFGNSLPYFSYAAGMAYGGVLVSQNEVKFQNVIKVVEALLFGSMNIGQALAFTPAFTTAFVAGHRLLRILERKPRILSPENPKPNENEAAKMNVEHAVQYSKVEFRYPKRPDVPVLQGLDLAIDKGKTIALVGHSGCGKSTCVQLLQRLYDPDNGKILLGHSDISTDISLTELRSNFGIVSQEPVLFERTIAENIAYGDSTREVPLSEIMEVAKMANIHTFIISLPLGYDTRLGTKGTQLSGGEKQRIAIARALVRNPKVLLLDEATSALDFTSEKVVQAALDLACSGRTCLVIAHRLSTIQNADEICVIEHGRIVERGNHQNLLNKNGIYARLHKMQPTAN